MSGILKDSEVVFAVSPGSEGSGYHQLNNLPANANSEVLPLICASFQFHSAGPRAWLGDPVVAEVPQSLWAVVVIKISEWSAELSHPPGLRVSSLHSHWAFWEGPVDFSCLSCGISPGEDGGGESWVRSPVNDQGEKGEIPTRVSKTWKVQKSEKQPRKYSI